MLYLTGHIAGDYYLLQGVGTAGISALAIGSAFEAGVLVGSVAEAARYLAWYR